MTAVSHNYLIVSDFHLSEGVSPETGLTHPNEDFFQDVAFAQMVAHHVQLGLAQPWRLVVNGDVFDFLQVTSLPVEGEELAQVTGKQRYDELSENDRLFGLGTAPEEIAWKVRRIAAGHPLFFQAMAWFVAHEGHELVFLKGNHDVELYWPRAQQAMKDVLVVAYGDWQTAVAAGSDLAILPQLAGMPAQLSRREMHERLRFVPSFYYEPGLFYMEHGCQYDPANSFRDFEDPRLLGDDNKPTEQIELPEGSLFVRYFFNDVEKIHPFADNLKPITRYFLWVVTNAQSDFWAFTTRVLPQYLRAKGKIRQKKLKKVTYVRQVNGRTELDPFWTQLLENQEKGRATLHAASRKTTLGMVGSIALLLVALGLALAAVRGVAVGAYGWALLALLGTAVCLLAASTLSQSLNALLTSPYLYDAAAQVAYLLNGRVRPEYGPVPYFIFGHDHAARLMRLPTDAVNAPPYQQWYINTGSWIPVFSDEDQLERPSAHLTFLRIQAQRVAAGNLTPELLRWSEEANAPRPVRLFAR